MKITKSLIKDTWDLFVVLAVGWAAIYGGLSFPNIIIPIGYTKFKLATGIWFSIIALCTTSVMIEMAAKQSREYTEKR